jgi:hypothetical protein
MSANEAPVRQRVTHTQLREILDAHLSPHSSDDISVFATSATNLID